MRQLHTTHPHTAGITFLKGIEYLERPGPEYLALSTPSNPNALNLPGFRLLPPSSFPADGKVTWACEYDTWCVNPMVYCAFLLRRFAHHGGKLLERELRCPEEVFSLDLSSPSPSPSSPTPKDGSKIAPKIIINATGTGLTPDPHMTLTRGQTCLVAEPCDATVTRQNADGSWTFSVPRGFEGGTVIGGTKEVGDWGTAPSREVRERLLSRFVATYPGILKDGRKGLTVLGEIVGRRPTREGGPRIEGGEGAWEGVYDACVWAGGEGV
jgi:hypothetical protein